MDKLITIIVPVYNTEKYLERCVNSIVNQTYDNLEIILVDDGSTDNSGKICDEYAEKDGRIKVIHKENGGVSSARNLGLNVCSGDYVGFVDSDDTIEPNMYEILYTNLIENNADISICKFAWVKNNCIKKEETNEIEIINANNAICFSLIGEKFAGQLCNKLFKREILKDIRFDTEIFVYEDLLVLIQYLLKSNKVVYSSICLYNYYLRETSAYHSPFNEKQITAYNACLKINELLKNKQEYYKFKPYVDYAMINCNLYFLQKMVYDKIARKKHFKNVKKHLISSLNKGSRKLLRRTTKMQICIACFNFPLYCFIFKLKKTVV